MPEPVMRAYTITFDPIDVPGKYVLRQFDIHPGMEPVPGPVLQIADTLEQARAALPPEADVRFARSPEDDPVVVETWL